MINATVSHELRNPLNSLIGQVTKMKVFFQQLLVLLGKIEDMNLRKRIEHIIEKIEQCNNKMGCATKFIDFFVHDILDYTILNKDSLNFTKNVTIFNIEQAIHEIAGILGDKVDLKQIKMKIALVGFDQNFLVKSDKKRMQQILLNLYSNALKFTQRRGKINIVVEKCKDNDHIILSVIDTGIGIKKND